MSADTTYNGWKNYETWAVGMYLDGNYTGEGTYLYTLEIVDDLMMSIEAGPRRRWNVADALKLFVTNDLAYDEEREGFTPNPLAADLLGAALSSVDWYELADAWIKTVAEQSQLA